MKKDKCQQKRFCSWVSRGGIMALARRASINLNDGSIALAAPGARRWPHVNKSVGTSTGSTFPATMAGSSQAMTI